MPLPQTMHFRAPTGNRKLALSSGLAATASSCEVFHSLITTKTPENLKSLTNDPRRLLKNESSLSEKLNLNQARYDEILLHELVRFGGKMFHEESRRLAKLGFASITFILRCSPSQLLRQSLRERYFHPRPRLSPRPPQGRLSVRPCVNPVFPAPVFSDCLLVSGVIGFAL